MLGKADPLAGKGSQPSIQLRQQPFALGKKLGRTQMPVLLKSTLMQALDLPQRSLHVLQVLGEDRGADAQSGRSLEGKGLQQVNGVNDECAVSCIFTLDVRELLNRLNGMMWVIN
ncbi:putative uncharacterized protein [Pseudomonas sp. Os17]|nr:putative uncharacterized protein [Pseudomonas sp. Os17]